MLVLDLLEVNNAMPSYILHSKGDGRGESNQNNVTYFSIEFGGKRAIILHTLLQVPKVILELLECHLMGMFGI